MESLGTLRYWLYKEKITFNYWTLSRWMSWNLSQCCYTLALVLVPLRNAIAYQFGAKLTQRLRQFKPHKVQILSMNVSLYDKIPQSYKYYHFFHFLYHLLLEIKRTIFGLYVCYVEEGGNGSLLPNRGWRHQNPVDFICSVCEQLRWRHSPLPYNYMAITQFCWLTE